MKVLVVIDMQNDFVSGVLGSPEAVAMVPTLANKIIDFDGMVIATYDTHDSGYMNTQEGSFLPVPHCIVGSDGWQLADEVLDALRKRRGDYKEFRKPTFGSAEMGAWLLEQQLAGANIDEIELVGVCTDICVISNALLIKAFLPEVKISVDASCCAGVTQEAHENALRAMRQCQIVIKNWEA